MRSATMMRRRRRGILGSFLPTALAGLLLWLDASDLTTITHVLGAVSQWDDKSGNGNHATQGTAARQLATGLDTINGLNVLTTDNDWMELPAGVYSVTESHNTAFFVYQRTSGNGANERLIMGDDASNLETWNMAIGSTGTAFNYRSHTTQGSTQVITNNFDAHIGAGRRNIGGVTGYYDGTAGSTVAGQDRTLAAAYIGRNFAGEWDMVKGYFAEIIVYSTDLSDAEMNQVGNYQGNKWAISWADI